MSDRILTENETEVLKKGLSFVPHNRFKAFTWIKDLNLFVRKLKWHKFFKNQDRNEADNLGIDLVDLQGIRDLSDLLGDNENAQARGYTTLKPKSTRMPPTMDCPEIDLFLKLVTAEFEKMDQNYDTYIPGKNKNLKKSEMEALLSLEKDDTIILKPADKGGNLVLMDHKKYTTMCYQLLRDKETYTILGKDPTDDFLEELRGIVVKALDDGVITCEESKFILIEHPRVATFYTLPKIHKGLMPLRGRPIVSGVDCLSQNASIYVDHILQSFVKALPSHIRDTPDLIKKIEGITVDGDAKLASIDVEALYSSIPHSWGLKAVEYFLKTRGLQHRLHNIFVLQLLEFILQHNYFLFDSKIFHQLRGTAMGSPCAPTYANLFLGWWEDTHIFGDDSSIWTPSILYWGRFIDDIFILWNNSELAFRQFVDSLNVNEVGLRFTSEIENHRLPFLDILVEKDRRGNLFTNIFRKPTASNSLLKWQSHHPIPLKKGIPKGQFLRVRRNCSRMKDYHHQARELGERFLKRGYPRDTLETAYQHALCQDRNKLLIPKPHQKDANEGKVRVITTFDERSEEAVSIIKKYWEVLKMDPELQEIVPLKPQVTYRRGRSIRDRMVHSHYVRPKAKGTWLDRRPTGTFRCGKDCVACPYVCQGKTFVTLGSTKEYNQYHFANCVTSGVVYLCTCECPLSYVGKTKRQLRRRIGEHLGDIRHGRDTPLARHVNEIHGGDPKKISFKVIEVIRPSERRGDWNKVILQKEVQWIHRLRTLEPLGLNDQMHFGCFI